MLLCSEPFVSTTFCKFSMLLVVIFSQKCLRISFLNRIEKKFCIKQHRTQIHITTMKQSTIIKKKKQRIRYTHLSDSDRQSTETAKTN